MLALQLLVNGILLGGLYVLVAQSLNLIFGVMGVVNLAHGAVIALAGLFTFWFSTSTGLSPLLVLPIAFVVAGLAGALDDRLPRLGKALMVAGLFAATMSALLYIWLNRT